MWEKAYIEAEIEYVLDRLNTSAIDVGGVGDDLENIERDSDRKDDLVHDRITRSEQVIECVRKEICVFEIGQEAQIYGDRQA